MLRRALLDPRSAAPPPHTATAHGPVCPTIRNRTRSCSSVSCWNPSAAPNPTTACLLLVASSSYASAPPVPAASANLLQCLLLVPLLQLRCATPCRHGPHPSAMPFSCCCPSSHAPTPTAMRSARCYGTTAPEVSPVSRRPCVPCHPHSFKGPPQQPPDMVPDSECFQDTLL